MPLPANRVDTVRVPNDTTTYDIVPSSLQDGSGKHSIATPTTTKDTTLVVGVKINNVTKEPTNGIVDLGTFQDGLDGDQLAAVNSGIDATKVDKYEGYETKINSNTTEITTIKETLKSGVTFKGTVTGDELPPATDYNNGDLIIFGKKEYICFDKGTSKEWIELGDEGTHLTKTMADTYYVKKLGTGTNYRVYMVSPDGTDTSRVVSSSVVNGAVPLRTSAGQLALPDQSTDVPVANNAISLSYADRRYQYQMDGKTTDFHSVTTLRWLDANNNNEMVLNGNVLLYNNGKLTASFYPEYLRYKTDNVYWSELVDLVSNKAPLLNGDKGAIGSYTSAGNGVSSVTTFAGQEITNTAKGINSFALGALNNVEGVGCFAYGGANTCKGGASIALGMQNTSGDKVSWSQEEIDSNSKACITLGSRNTSTGNSSIALGISNRSLGEGAVTIGINNEVRSSSSVAMGRNNTLDKSGEASTTGSENDNGNGVMAIGAGLKSPFRYSDQTKSNLYWDCVVLGRYNDPFAYGCARETDTPRQNSFPPVFTLGNGIGDTGRNNAVVVFHDAGIKNHDWIYFNDYSIFNKKCEFRGPENIVEGKLTINNKVKLNSSFTPIKTFSFKADSYNDQHGSGSNNTYEVNIYYEDNNKDNIDTYRIFSGTILVRTLSWDRNSVYNSSTLYYISGIYKTDATGKVLTYLNGNMTTPGFHVDLGEGAGEPPTSKIVNSDIIHILYEGGEKTIQKKYAYSNDIPKNIKDGTGYESINQVKDGTGTTFSIDDSSGNSKNPNAYALDNTIKGDIVFGGVGQYSTSLGGKSSAQGKRSVAQGTTTIAKGNYSHAEGDNSVALGPDSHAEGYATVTYGKASHSEGTSTQALGEGSHAEGSNTKATKTGAHSEGEETDASGYASHTEGLFNKVLSEIPADTGGSGSGITPPPSTGWNIEEHRGDAGHAEGYGNVVYGFASHAEGHQNKSSGHYSHSEGLLNTASGNYSHAEGTGCLASGTGAHAGGSYCYAITSNAFAHGQSLTTNIPNQAVLGEYNLDLPFSSRETQYLFAIGNGTDANHRSNAFVSYKDGRAAIGKDPVNDLDVATKGYVDRGIGVKQDKITPTNKLPASNVSGLATVATSGSYSDLSNKPTIPDTDNLVPYTGGTKDVNIGNHSLIMGDPTLNTLTFDPATISFVVGDYKEALYIDTRTVTVDNGTTDNIIYWPGAKDPTPGAKVFALTSDITSHAGIDKVGTVTSVNGTSPDSNGNVTITIPSAVTETTVSGWGFTKNKGTVTGLKVNGLSKAPDTNGTVDVGNVCTYTNTQVDTKIDAASQKMVSIIYDDLVTARNSKDLVPGMNYRITDYTAVISPGSVTEKSAGHQFDLIVTADGPDTLNENARAILHEGDTYFKDCDLNSWRLKYCLDNDRSRFYWAYEKGKGVIYWMEDEFHNQVPYDFKNIMFKRYKVKTVGKNTPVSFDSFFSGTGNLSLTDCISPVKTSAIGDVASDTSIWCYTFCTFENNDPTIPLDASLNLFPDGIVVETPRLLSFLHAFDNVIEPLIVCSPSIETTKKNYQRLNNIVFMKYDKDTSVDTKDDFRVYGNRFSSSSQNITLGRKCYYNTFNGNNLGLMVGYGCAENTFTTCGNTAIAYNCSGNIFNSRFGYNLVFNNCKNNSFGMKCQYLELGENSSFNTFEDDISYVRLVADATGTEPLQYVTVSKGVKGTGSGVNMLHLSQPRGLTHTVTYRRVQSETIDV